MKRLILSGTAIWLCVLISTFAAEPKDKGPEYYLVQFTGYSGKASNEVLTAQEYDARKKEVDAEAKVFDRALKLTEQDWKSSDSTKNRPFPKSGISQKKLKLVNKYTDMGKATDKLNSLKEKQVERAKDDQKQLEETRKTLKLTDDQVKKDEKKAKDGESIRSLALKLFQNKLTGLLGPTASSTDTSAVPAQAATPAEQKK